MIIQPYLGTLNEVSVTSPHPNGNIAVNYSKSTKGLKADIVLPAQVTGTFVWKNIIYPLHPGKNSYVIND